MPDKNDEGIQTPLTKSQLISTLAEETGLTRKDVSAVLEGLVSVVSQHMSPGAAGQFTLPGLLKIRSVHKPATKERKGINPFTKEETVFQAKPARTAVKITPLKGLKDMTE